jgi:FkbM family methyltransferase
MFSRVIKQPVIFPYASKSKLIIKKGLSGATGNYYCGLQEFEDMSFLLHFLREPDLFMDIGANIGSFSILASSETGASTFAFEPIPETYKMLENNIYINNIQDKVKLYNKGVGEKNETLNFTTCYDVINHVALQNGPNTVGVEILTLNDICRNNIPSLLKIDVEGFEYHVIKGAGNILPRPELKAIIIELNGSGKRYGIDDTVIHELLLKYGFKSYKYFPFQRKLEEINYLGSDNTIYIRDLDFVKARVESSPSYKIYKVAI